MAELCFRFGRGQPVIDPYELKEDEVLRDRAVILTFHPTLLTKAKNTLEDAKPVRLSGWLFKSFMGVYRGRKLLVALPYPGSPSAAAALETLAAMGGRVFIVIGRIGAIHPTLNIGDVLVPSWGLREEGTSFHYIPSKNYIPKPDDKLADALHKHIIVLKQRRGIRVLKGGVWTTDAIFRETIDKIVEYSSKGIYGVDMESTALMTVAQYRGVRLAIIASVSDELRHDGKWIRGFQSRRLNATEKLIVKASLDTVAQL